MAEILLVRHSLPDIEPGVPACQWQLSEEGVRRCILLAEALLVHQPQIIVTSEEPKAQLTGRLSADLLRINWLASQGLHEHERNTVPWQSREAFKRKVRLFFNQPDRLVLGEETANQAQQRIVGAVLKVVALHPTKKIAIVSHGTVMTLFVAKYNKLAPFDFWQALQMPSIVSLSIPDFKLLEFRSPIG